MEHLVNFLCLPLHKVENHILKLNFVTTRQGGKGTAMSCSKNQKCLSFFEQGCRFPKGDVTVDNSKRQFLVQWCCVKTWCWVTLVHGHFLGNFYVTSFWTGIKNFRCQIINSINFGLYCKLWTKFLTKKVKSLFSQNWEHCKYSLANVTLESFENWTLCLAQSCFPLCQSIFVL